MTMTVKPLRRAVAINATSADFTAKIPVATEPTGVGVHAVFDKNRGDAIDTCAPSHLQVVPIGTDANNETFAMRVWGWSKVHDPGVSDHAAWVPQLVAELACTLGNISAAALGADLFMVDAIAVTDGAAEGDFRSFISPESDTPGSILVHLRGCEKFEFDFDLGTAAAANALWRVMDNH